MTESEILLDLHNVEVYFQEQGVEIVNCFCDFVNDHYYVEIKTVDGIHFYIQKRLCDTINVLTDIWIMKPYDLGQTHGILHELIIKWREL